MPEANFDRKLNLPTVAGAYIKLKAKGDKIKFRIANTPHYETLHWITDKKFELCGRFNADDPNAECKYCDQTQAAVEAGNEDLVEQIKPKTTFYYPILNLDTGKPAIFQFNAKRIHYTIKGYADDGIDVFGCDWTVERLEESGNYYPVARLKEYALTPELQKQYVLASKLKLKARESGSVVIEK